MQAVKNVSFDQLKEIVNAVFEQGPVIVKEASSEYDSPTREFANASTLLESMSQTDEKKRFFAYSLYYPEAKGVVHERKIKLIPEKCGGHTFRFSQEGWGLIQLQCNFRYLPEIECRIAVNSSARADNWKDTYPKIGNRHYGTGRLLRKKRES
jgi:hypothetical protein